MISHSLTFDYFISNKTGPSSDLTLDNFDTSPLSSDILLTVYPRWLKHMAVQWEIPYSWGHCLFNIYFSQIEDSAFEKLNSTPIDGTYFVDDTTQEYRKFNEGFYIVEALPQEPGLGIFSLRSSPSTWRVKQNSFASMRAKEINRREYLLLTKFVGVKSYLFRRKNYGKRCHVCWNHRAEQITMDHCKTCVGTGFEGGYFEPTPVYLQYDATQNKEDRTYSGISETSSISAWTIAYPSIHPDDILVKVGEWAVYRVEGIEYTALQTVSVRQILRLVELSKDDVEHQLVVRGLEEFPE